MSLTSSKNQSNSPQMFRKPYHNNISYTVVFLQHNICLYMTVLWNSSVEVLLWKTPFRLVEWCFADGEVWKYFSNW